MEKISWTDCVRNEEVVRTVKEEEYPTQNKKKGGLIGLITSYVGTVF
jgi:hypothetical protein